MNKMIELTPELIIYSERLSNWLKTNRALGNITPDNPRNAAQIVLNADGSAVKIKVEDVYKMVHYRRELGDWIASCQRGYFWALKPEEFDPMIIEQTKKMQLCQETLRLGKLLKENCFKANNTLLNSPTAQILNNGSNSESNNSTKETNGENSTQEAQNDRDRN